MNAAGEIDFVSDAYTTAMHSHPDLAVDALDYHLPPELIATRPAQPRDSARLLVVRRSSERIEHRRVRDLPEFLVPGDLVVQNDTAVAPARFRAVRMDTGGAVEGLFLSEPHRGAWRVMLKSSGKLRSGMRVLLLGHDGVAHGGAALRAAQSGSESRHHQVELLLDEKNGAEWVARVEPTADAMSVLDQIGWTPLPPYILKARRDADQRADASLHTPGPADALHARDELDALNALDALDRAWYQTVYADASKRGSVAAPTAGLHFTPELLARIEAMGVDRMAVTLHVGPGTFKPVEAATLAGHIMHHERYEVSAEALRALQRARDDGRRIIAVGTTTVRVLESLPDLMTATKPSSDSRSESLAMEGARGDTNLLIAPGHRFRHVDALMTNFHLPRSTLLALVAAMLGLERTHTIYADAVRERYRFYSYGDALLILP